MDKAKERDKKKELTAEQKLEKDRRRTAIEVVLAFVAAASTLLSRWITLSQPQLDFLILILSYAILVTASFSVALFLALFILNPLGEFEIYRKIRRHNFKEMIKVTRDEQQILGFSYFVAVILLAPVICFIRTFLLGETNSMSIVDIGMSAFVVYSGRALLCSKLAAGKLFFGTISFFVIILYSQLLTSHMFPLIDYAILLPATGGVSLALATAGEKLIKLRRYRRSIISSH